MKIILKRIKNQAGAELCQAQVKLEVVVEMGVEVEVCHYYPGGCVVGGWTKTKLMLNSN